MTREDLARWIEALHEALTGFQGDDDWIKVKSVIGDMRQRLIDLERHEARNA